MPKLIFIKDVGKLIVGDTSVTRGWPWARKVITEDASDGNAIVFLKRHVRLTKEVQRASWDADVKAQKARAEQDQSLHDRQVAIQTAQMELQEEELRRRGKRIVTPDLAIPSKRGN